MPRRKKKRCVRDGVLVASAHNERVDAQQVPKCRVRDGLLVAEAHVELAHAPQVQKVDVSDGPVKTDVSRTCMGKASAPVCQAAADARLFVLFVKVLPRMLCHRLTARAAGGAQAQHLILPQVRQDGALRQVRDGQHFLQVRQARPALRARGVGPRRGHGREAHFRAHRNRRVIGSLHRASSGTRGLGGGRGREHGACCVCGWTSDF